MMVVGYWERISFGGEDKVLRRKEVVERSVEEKLLCSCKRRGGGGTMETFYRKFPRGGGGTNTMDEALSFL